MATRRRKAARKLRGAQKWIMAEISALRPSESLSTAQIAKRIKKASGKEFHKNSVYLALRKLVSGGSILAVRNGQEKNYKLSKSGGAPSSATPPRSSAASAPVEVSEPTGAVVVASTDS